MDDEADYSRRIAELTRNSVFLLRFGLLNSGLHRRSLSLFFAHGYGLGFSTSELVDLLGVSSPSLLDTAGWPDAEAARALNLIATLSDDEISRAPAKSAYLVLLAPIAGRYEVKVQSGSRPRWCAVEYRAHSDGRSPDVSMSYVRDSDADTQRWAGYVVEGAKHVAKALEQTGVARAKFTLEITRVVAHPIDTDAEVCRQRGAGLFRELCRAASVEESEHPLG